MSMIPITSAVYSDSQCDYKKHTHTRTHNTTTSNANHIHTHQCEPPIKHTTSYWLFPSKSTPVLSSNTHTHKHTLIIILLHRVPQDGFIICFFFYHFLNYNTIHRLRISYS